MKTFFLTNETIKKFMPFRLVSEYPVDKDRLTENKNRSNSH